MSEGVFCLQGVLHVRFVLPSTRPQPRFYVSNFAPTRSQSMEVWRTCMSVVSSSNSWRFVSRLFNGKILLKCITLILDAFNYGSISQERRVLFCTRLFGKRPGFCARSPQWKRAPVCRNSSDHAWLWFSGDVHLRRNFGWTVSSSTFSPRSPQGCRWVQAYSFTYEKTHSTCTSWVRNSTCSVWVQQWRLMEHFRLFFLVQTIDYYSEKYSREELLSCLPARQPQPWFACQNQSFTKNTSNNTQKLCWCLDLFTGRIKRTVVRHETIKNCCLPPQIV